jgi:hypothetical protein
MTLGPALVISLLVGAFHAGLFMLLRQRGGWQMIPIWIAAALGAWAGDATGGRLGDPLRIGDYHLVAGSVVAWAGIGFVVVVSILNPSRDEALWD